MTSGPELDAANEQEIFEFPWVVFDVADKQVVDEKTVHVKPVLHEGVGVQCAKASLGDEAAAKIDAAGTLQHAVQVGCVLWASGSMSMARVLLVAARATSTE